MSGLLTIAFSGIKDMEWDPEVNFTADDDDSDS